MKDLIITDNHEYFFKNKKVDGLTSTIKEAGLIREGDPYYANKGTAVHLATEFYDRGTLDESTVDSQIQGYLDSWKKFRIEQNYIPTHIEYMIFHPELMVASKVDRLPLLEIKSGSQIPWHYLQVAFQWATLLLEHRESVKKPMTVYLDSEGESPKIKVYSFYELRENYKTYCSMLNFLRWRRQNGI
jgi:hypothetical protein